ncbi:MAG: hypothetical protein GX417_03145 [Clostridiales bacterium]|nr:hypothetical protein [Clostridiales bacterium]
MSDIKKNWDNVPNWAKYTLYTVLGLAGAFLLGLLFGNVIMWLWNWLMPSLFGLRTIGFWEGLGLFLLAHILLGFGGSSHSGDGESKRCKKKHRNGGTAEKKDWKDWEYYDDWWEEDGKTAFHAYADRMKKDSGTDKEAKSSGVDAK